MIIVVDHLCNVKREHEMCFCPGFCPLPSSIPTLTSTSSGISMNLWDLEFQTSLLQGESIDCHISRVTFKDNWQTFPLQVKAQLRELVFILNKHTGLTIKINIQGIGRKGGGAGEAPSHVTDGRLELGSEATLGSGKPFYDSSWWLPRKTHYYASCFGMPWWRSLR